jgi:hypothetical protein
MTNTKIEITEEVVQFEGNLVAVPIINVSVEAIQNKEELDRFFKTIRGAAESLWTNEPVKPE